VDAIVNESSVTDRILGLGDFQLLKLRWLVQEDGATLQHTKVVTDLEIDLLIEGMLGCDLGQINSALNQ
jgi:hypothetical protein